MNVKFAYLLATLVALLQLTSASFDLYQVVSASASSWDSPDERDIMFSLPFLTFWQVHDSTPTCDQIYKTATPWFSWSRDLSHGRVGVRCEGNCSILAMPSEVDVVEMHFTNKPPHHYTIYKDDGHESDGIWRRGMWGTNGVLYGECWANVGDDQNCINEDTKFLVKRKFSCMTNDRGATAKSIVDIYKKEHPGEFHH